MLATGASELFTPVMGGMNNPMGIGGAIDFQEQGTGD